MKLTINLSRRQIDSLRNFLQKKYKSKKKVETLARVYLLEFIAAASKIESDAWEDAAFDDLWE